MVQVHARLRVGMLSPTPIERTSKAFAASLGEAQFPVRRAIIREWIASLDAQPPKRLVEKAADVAGVATRVLVSICTKGVIRAELVERRLAHLKLGERAFGVDALEKLSFRIKEVPPNADGAAL